MFSLLEKRTGFTVVYSLQDCLCHKQGEYSSNSTVPDTVLCRQICEATMDIIRGNTVPINMMQLEVCMYLNLNVLTLIDYLSLSQPESGKTLYALSSIHWGVFRDSLEIKDR